MSAETKKAAGASPDTDLHLVCGSGGVRAILASTGAILAGHHAGLRNWRTAGGASGGAIPTSLLASGFDAVKVTHLAIETDFSRLVSRHGSLLEVLAALALKDNVYRIIRPRIGVLSSRKMGEFIDSLAGGFPAAYWTVAVEGKRQIVFRKDEVIVSTSDGGQTKGGCAPAGLGLAVRASTAIPGVFDAIPYCRAFLHDGALTFDGRTPVNIVKRLFGARPETIIAVDTGWSAAERNWLGRLIWRLVLYVLCGGDCPVEGKTPIGSDGVVLIQPDVRSVHSLQFGASRDQKWRAVMCGFLASIEPLSKSGYLAGESLETARLIERSYQAILTSSRKDGELSLRTEALLSAHGLY